jgi:NADPH-dependent ferric siderophore reductase
MALQFTTSYLEDSLALLRYYKKLAERAMEQVADEHLFTALDAEANSIAIIVKHMTGNMRSRWTDFLSTDGEKPSRNRDGEFVDPPPTRETLMAGWDSGWACVFAALESLTDQDLTRTVTIRGEAHSVMQAINRQLAHYPHHIGQIVLLAKHFACDHWQSISVPRNRSAEFNRKVAAGEASQR